MIDGSGNSVVQYTYDDWGNHASHTGAWKNSGSGNPLQIARHTLTVVFVKVNVKAGTIYL